MAGWLYRRPVLITSGKLFRRLCTVASWVTLMCWLGRLIPTPTLLTLVLCDVAVPLSTRLKGAPRNLFEAPHACIVLWRELTSPDSGNLVCPVPRLYSVMLTVVSVRIVILE